MKMNPKLFVSKKIVRMFKEKKLLPTDNLITLTYVKQVSGLIWGLWLYFCQCLIPCHADELLVEGLM